MLGFFFAEVLSNRRRVLKYKKDIPMQIEDGLIQLNRAMTNSEDDR